MLYMTQTPAAIPLPSSPTLTATASTRIKYAKTLRLTSDQLVSWISNHKACSRRSLTSPGPAAFHCQKSLNLKKGPNTITFSLSATGVAACTAKVFLWDSTDGVVISDIDGTITKYVSFGFVRRLG